MTHILPNERLKYRQASPVNTETALKMPGPRKNDIALSVISYIRALV